MASLITVSLNKSGAPSLGFRLQGGKDFGTPLVIQKVNGGSPAERAGLIAGDSVIKINNVDVFNLRHKDAQDVIVRAGPAFEVTVQRGGSTWKPSVTPAGSFPTTPSSIHNVSPVTKTSLASSRNDNIGAIGTGHNLSAKPFSPQLNGTVNGSPKLVNNQYNSPLKLYSEESIAETLSAQTEVLSTGALGVNFKKNEKNYDATNSAVFRMLQEAEKEPRTQESEPDSGVVTAPIGIAGLRHVVAPETRSTPATPQLPPGQNICADCERLIVGVFVRIKDKNLHVECFKCSTCGTSLKNVGYYNINNKLYCDVHAKLAAISSRPGPNLVPVTVPPGGKAPANAISAALSSHSLPSPSPLSPRSNLAAPFQLPPPSVEEEPLSAPLQSLSVTSEPNNNKFSNNSLLNSTPLSFDKYINKAGSYSGPKPFSSVSAPSYNTLPRTAPLSPIAQAPAPSYSPASSAGGRSVQNIVWPPPPEEPEVPTACPLYFPPPSQVNIPPPKKRSSPQEECYLEEELEELHETKCMAQAQEPKLSVCSEEVFGLTGRRSASECVEAISNTLERQQLVECVLKQKQRPLSPQTVEQRPAKGAAKALEEFKVSEVTTANMENKSVVHEEASVKETHVRFAEAQETSSTCSSCITMSTTSESEVKGSCELKRLSQFSPNLRNVVPQKWESSMLKALRTVPEPEPDSFTQIPEKRSSSAFASALSVAPANPFNPSPHSALEIIPLPEETVPYFPPEHPVIPEEEPEPVKEKKGKDKKQAAKPEKDAGEMPVPVRKKKDPTLELLKDLPKPQQRLTMRDALTTASERPYSPLIFDLVDPAENAGSGSEEKRPPKEDLQRPLKPAALPESFQKEFEQKPQVPRCYVAVSTVEHSSDLGKNQQLLELVEASSTATKSEELTQARACSRSSVTTTTTEAEGVGRETPSLPLFKGFSCSFGNKTEHSEFRIDICTTPPAPNAEAAHPKAVTVTETKTVNTDDKKESKKESREESNRSCKTIQRQAEDVILKKTAQAVSLHKPEGLPQYQVNLTENAEAELLLMERKKAGEERIELKKQQQVVEMVCLPNPSVRKPVIKVEEGDQAPPQQSFKPVSEASERADTPQSQTFSPRPRPMTPSMINKPPPVLPYYQAILAPQFHRPASVNLLDPKSPAVSRSPSPCPERQRPSTPYQKAPGAAADSLRTVSPGPPSNPLRSNTPLPTPHDSRIEVAKQNITTYIPQHQSKVDLYSTLQVDVSGDTRVTTQQAQLEESSKSQSQTLQKCRTGNVEIQRKKTVTEEFEHSQKMTNIQIEKNISAATTTTASKSYPFRAVNKPPAVDEQAIMGLHVTNPSRIDSPFLRAKGSNTTPQQPSVEPACKSTQPPKQAQASPPPSRQPAIEEPVCAPPFKPSPITPAPIKHVSAPSGSAQPPNVNKSNIPGVPNTGAGGGRQAGAIGVAPKRGRGVLNTAALGGTRVPLCGHCHAHIRGPFITALGKIWCPEHFICATPSCRRPLQDLGFVEERGQLYCEYCFEQYLAPPCSKCNSKIKGDCLKAIGKNFHPECFNCVYCNKLFGNSPFFLEDGSPYCETDWNELFTTKCYACGFPVEAGDRWVEALNNNYHSQCFNCTMCKKNLEGQSFFAKGGRPFCKNHAR